MIRGEPPDANAKCFAFEPQILKNASALSTVDGNATTRTKKKLGPGNEIQKPVPTWELSCFPWQGVQDTEWESEIRTVA